MDISLRYSLGIRIYVLVYTSQWIIIEGIITSIVSVIDSNGQHESYMINTQPNVLFDLDHTFESEESGIIERNKRPNSN